MGVRAPLSAGGTCILCMDSSLRAAAEYVLGLRCMDGIFSAREDNTLLGWRHIIWSTFDWCANSLGRRTGLGSRGWGPAAGKDDAFLGWYSSRHTVPGMTGRTAGMHLAADMGAVLCSGVGSGSLMYLALRGMDG